MNQNQSTIKTNWKSGQDNNRERSIWIMINMKNDFQKIKHNMYVLANKKIFTETGRKWAEY